MEAATGLVDAAEATANPCALVYALQGEGFAFRNTDPGRAHEALRRALVIAQASGNRTHETNLASGLCALEAQHGDPLTAFDYVTVAIRNLHESGSTANIRSCARCPLRSARAL
jgi:hypothetical protein